MSETTFVSGAPRERGNSPAATATDRLPHYVSRAPFDPYSVERMTAAQERFYMASEWRMVWWKLSRHRIAVFNITCSRTIWLVIVFADSPSRVLRLM